MCTFKTSRLSLLSLASSLLLLAPSSAQGKANDVILQKSGKRIRGVEVTEMSSSAIKFQRGTTAEEIPASDFARVQWDEPPESFMLAEGAVKRGDFATAANLYGETAKNTARPALKLESQFLAADALARSSGGDPARAQAALDALAAYLSAAPDGYRAPDAMLQLGRTQVLAGKASEAETNLAKLETESSSKNWDPIWAVRAGLEKARAQLAQAKLNDARSTFRATVTAAEALARQADSADLQDLIAEASVGEGETLVAEKKYDLAVQFFRNLLTGASNRSVSAAAQAGLGEALYLKADATDDDRELRAAQLALATANILDSTAEGTTAKALYYSGMVLIALGPDREQQDYKSRAIEYFRTVTRYYPQSAWAAKATQEMSK
ncbi:MAG: tetratricopeptide repeat protein [Planctomycetota bacterium]|jgi:TolA-binding protein